MAVATPATTFANGTEAKAAGAAPLWVGLPGYARKLDRDGIACEMGCLSTDCSIETAKWWD